MRQTTTKKIKELCVCKHRDVGQKDCKCQLCEILGLLDQEERAEHMAKDVQELIHLANVTASFVDMKPDHRLYPTVRRDVQDSLDRLRNKHKDLLEDV